jgi:protein-tyrosine-phosphatase
MAEAIALRDAADVMEASSAGLTPLGRVETMTKQTLASNGLPSEKLTSKLVAASALNDADIVINMSGQMKEIAFHEHSKVEDWRVEDPYGADAELYQRIFEDIERRVAELAKRLRDADGSGAVCGKSKGKDIGKRGRLS